MSTTSLFANCNRTICGAPAGALVTGSGVANAIADSPGATWANTPAKPANRIVTTQESLSTGVFTWSVYHGQPASPREKRVGQACRLRDKYKHPATFRVVIRTLRARSTLL